MIKEIIKYPTTPSLEFGVDIRVFDDAMVELAQDIKDTMNANSLDALSAYQIGSPKTLIILREENGDFLELINPTIVKREGKIETVEKTAYFPGLSANISRYKKIKVMYVDRDLNTKFLEAEDDLAVTIQRKIDYLFGANIRLRLSKEEQKTFDEKLEYGTDSITDNGCPTVFKRDRITQAIKALFALSFVALLSLFFLSDESVAVLESAENYAMIALFVLIVTYFFYAQYEGKQYKQCSSCQIGNIVGVTAIEFAKLIVLFGLNYFLLW